MLVVFEDCVVGVLCGVGDFFGEDGDYVFVLLEVLFVVIGV